MRIQKPYWIIAAASLFTAGLLVYYFSYQGAAGSAPQQSHQIIQSDGNNAPLGMVWIPGGEFLMGSDNKRAQANEKPIQLVLKCDTI
jgi:formylglycine-generating enzyme required for sulfatase activity